MDPHKQLLGEMDTNPENLQMAGNQIANELANGMSQIQPREMIPMFKHQTMALHGLTFVHHETCPPRHFDNETRFSQFSQTQLIMRVINS